MGGLFAAAAIGAAAIALFDAPGTTDVTTYWLPWIDKMRRHGLLDGYAALGSDYPPLSSALLYAAGSLGSRLWTGPDAAFLGLKLVLVLFWIGTLFVVWRLVGPRESRPVDTALIGAALLLNAVAMAYLDILVAPAFLLAIGCLRAAEQTAVPRERLRLAAACGVCLSLALWTKWQLMIILPFVAVGMLKRGKDESRGVAWAMLVFTLLMFALYGSQIVLALRRAMLHSSLSAQAFNANWIAQYILVRAVTGLTTALDAGGEGLIVYGPGTAVRIASRVLFLSSYGAALAHYARTGRTLSDLLMASLVGFLCYVNFSLGVHENHLFVVTLLAAALLMLDPGCRRLFVLWAVLANLNLVVFYGISGRGLGFSRVVVGIDSTLLFAAIEVGAFSALYRASYSRGGSTLRTTDK